MRVLKKWLPAILGVVTAAVVVGGVVGVARLDVEGQDTETTAVGSGEELRWRNVILRLPPAGSPLRVTPDYPRGPQAPRYLIHVSIDGAPPPSPEDESTWQELQIDADTGEIVMDTLSRDYRSEVDAVLGSLRVDPLRPDVWPYSDGSAPAETSVLGTVRYAQPALASGIRVGVSYNYCLPSPTCSQESLVVTNGFSYMHVRADNGEIMSLDRVQPEDVAAFERYAQSVQVTTTE